MWSRQFGDTGADSTLAVGKDSSGNVLAGGYFAGTTNFGGGSVSSVTNALGSSKDGFVAKYNSAGTYSWARAIGGTADDDVRSVAADPSGNILVAGTQNSATIDYGGGAQVTPGGSGDFFIAKYSSAGAWSWSKVYGGFSTDQVNSVVADSAGNVYVTGYISPSASGILFGCGSTTLTSAGVADIFLIKYSSAGVCQWGKRFGSTGNDVGVALAVDAADNVVLAGTFNGVVNVGGALNLTSAGLRDVFVAKYDPAGTYISAYSFGSTGDDVVSSLNIDTVGNVAIAGEFQGTVSFGGTALVSSGGFDAFVASYSPSMVFRWSKKFGNTSSDNAIGVTTDAAGNVDLTGYFAGAVDFGGGALTATGLDIFVAQFSTSGSYLKSGKYGSTGTQIGNSVTSPTGTDIVIGGQFDTAIDVGTGTLTSAGSTDALVAHINP